MEFDGTSFTVPEDGIYYVYGQVVTAETVTKDCGFTIVVSNAMVSLPTFLTVSHPASADKDITIFGSQVRRLDKGNAVQMMTTNCSYSFEADKADFGMFQLKG